MVPPELHWVRGIEPVRLALMPRPRGGHLLEGEVAGWREESINVVVSLLEAREMLELELQAEPKLCEQHGIEFRHLPIQDWGVPKATEPLKDLLLDLRTHLEQGCAVAIHCRAGIGRTGLVAASLLHLLRVPSADIFHVLSRSRGVSMPATSAQAEWVEQFCRTHDGR